mmetsp:Transcript_3332/g.9487  ORF Transcript_3332/g.9487 Transcript_3332/m.9487 type:complete len:91 (-) Transcript_3332:824-1096(-)
MLRLKNGWMKRDNRQAERSPPSSPPSAWVATQMLVHDDQASPQDDHDMTRRLVPVQQDAPSTVRFSFGRAIVNGGDGKFPMDMMIDHGQA